MLYQDSIFSRKMTSLMEKIPELKKQTLGGSVESFLPGSVIVRGLISFREVHGGSRNRRQVQTDISVSDIQQQITEALQNTEGLLGNSTIGVDETGITVLGTFVADNFLRDLKKHFLQ